MEPDFAGCDFGCAGEAGIETGFAVKNLALDEEGQPRWESAMQLRGPKADFAFEAAQLMQAGKLTLEGLKEQIVEAANVTFRSRGGFGDLGTLNDVKKMLGGSAKDWYFEFQRVAANPEGLAEIIANEGSQLTALARRYGPIQAQRSKGFAYAGPEIALKELAEAVLKIRQQTKNSNDWETLTRLSVRVEKDLSYYNKVCVKMKGTSK